MTSLYHKIVNQHTHSTHLPLLANKCQR
uniref:Uncharacterized protein n=1 Tax=Anguilla anguilla TaxID=7936 RepID=A0A0E9SH00_ANGAN